MAQSRFQNCISDRAGETRPQTTSVGARHQRGGVGSSASATLLLALAALFSLAGCLPGGGGSGGADTEAAVAVDPVYLTPGATTATLAWAPSEGAVDAYLIFESRNGSLFEYSTSVNQPSADIAGVAGDSVQITVVAVSPTGQLSDSSPPSPPMVFQEAPAAAAVAVLPGSPSGANAAPVSVDESAAPTAQAVDDSTSALADAANDAEDVDANEATTDEGVTIERLATDVREMLLESNARLPETELSSEARAWLQNRVDAEMAAGVSLAGTGVADDDALRELVWQDHAGQLFVSSGADALVTDDLTATFQEAIRLRATERFVGLADFDGDGVGDWLIEDTATAEAWVVDGTTDAMLAITAPADTNDGMLAGIGDFDGDGRAEVLWSDDDGRLGLSRPTGDTPALDAHVPALFDLLAIADFDGDGRDDLLGRDGSGLLLLGSAEAAEARIDFAWSDAGAEPPPSVELVATLDTDGDGAAELALLEGDTIEMRQLVR